MRRATMRRRLVIFAASVCVVIVAALAVLWVRSYWVTDLVFFKSHGGSLWFFHATGGIVEAQRVTEWPDEGINWWLTFPLPRDEIGNTEYPGMNINYVEPKLAVKWQHFGISGTYGPTFQSSVFSYRGKTFSQVDLPLYLPFIFFGTLPTICTIRVGLRLLIRRRRQRKGCCLSCGYDNRGSKDRCPECGAAIVIS